MYDETSIILDRIDIILVIWGVDVIGTRYEEYEQLRNGLPFVLNAYIERSCYNLSKENNYAELAFETVKLEVTMGNNPYKGEDIPLYVAKRDSISNIITV